MAERAKLPVRSPEVETFHRYYNKLFSDIYSPVNLAELLFADGIISSETKENVILNTGAERTRTLLDAVQHTLEKAPDPGKTFQSLLVALRTSFWSIVPDQMEKFYSGEYTISLEASA